MPYDSTKEVAIEILLEEPELAEVLDSVMKMQCPVCNASFRKWGDFALHKMNDHDPGPVGVLFQNSYGGKE
jgi:hypothetical protein